eukprot:509297_1
MRSKGLFHIKMEDTMIDISESRFENNGWWRRLNYASGVSIISTDKNVDISLNIMESKFIHNTNGKYGCFDLYSGDINIIDSTFDSNAGHDYSVIILHVRKSGYLTINSSVFISNKEKTANFPTTLPKGLFNMKKGNIIVNNVTFDNNLMYYDGIHATGIYTTAQYTNIQLINNRYINNYVPKIVDGIMSNIHIENCTFADNNYADNNPTANMIEAKDVTVLYSTFTDNTGAPLFGYHKDTFTLNLFECNFTNNVDATYGAVVYVMGTNAHIDVENCEFNNNTVKRRGGGIFIDSTGERSIVSIMNSEIIGNSAQEAGGFLFGVEIILNINDTISDNNNGGWGGFLYFEHSEVTMKNVNLSGNNAHYSGGAIFADGYNTIELEKCDFDSNVANTLFGGGIYLYKSDLICNECIAQNNNGLFGGFIYIDEGSNVNMNDVIMLNNFALNGGSIFIANTSNGSDSSYFECINCNISRSTAQNGGVLLSEDGNNVRLYNNYIDHCQSDYGAILIYNNDFEITKSIFSENKAIRGGVMYINRDSNVIINESTFNDNMANYSGGVIFMGDNNKLNILSSKFESNTAVNGAGGAIAIKTGAGNNLENNNNLYMDIEDTLFIRNVAYKGGVIYIKRHSNKVEDADTYYHIINFKQGNNFINNRGTEGGVMYMDFRSNTPTGISFEVCD